MEQPVMMGVSDEVDPTLLASTTSWPRNAGSSIGVFRQSSTAVNIHNCQKRHVK